MDDFTVKPGVPNLFGLVQGEVNAIAPGKRPLFVMSPTIAVKDGKTFMVLAVLADRASSASACRCSQRCEHGMTIQER
jgi:gamma-glutamyltranspeptidase/glutathione hydrolase